MLKDKKIFSSAGRKRKCLELPTPHSDIAQTGESDIDTARSKDVAPSIVLDWLIIM